MRLSKFILVLFICLASFLQADRLFANTLLSTDWTLVATPPPGCTQILEEIKDLFAGEKNLPVDQQVWRQFFNPPVGSKAERLEAYRLLRLNGDAVPSPSDARLLSVVDDLEADPDLILFFRLGDDSVSDVVKLGRARAYLAAKAEGVAYRIDNLERLSSYILSFSQPRSASAVQADIADNPSLHEWMDRLIGSNDRGANRQKVFERFKMLYCARATKRSTGITKVALRALDKLGRDRGIDNFDEFYTFVRRNFSDSNIERTYTRQPDQTEADFIRRLKAAEDIFFNRWVAHHIFPDYLFKCEGFRIWYEKMGYNTMAFNGWRHRLDQPTRYNGDADLGNMVFVEDFRTRNDLGIHTGHEDYNQNLEEFFNTFWERALRNRDGDVDDAILDFNRMMTTLAPEVKRIITSHCIPNNIRINDFFADFDFETLIN